MSISPEIEFNLLIMFVLSVTISPPSLMKAQYLLDLLRDILEKDSLPLDIDRKVYQIAFIRKPFFFHGNTNHLAAQRPFGMIKLKLHLNNQLTQPFVKITRLYLL